MLDEPHWPCTILCPLIPSPRGLIDHNLLSSNWYCQSSLQRDIHMIQVQMLRKPSVVSPILR
ncbi:hypothetical protein HanRHA438_Chr10g0434651 [Helianthus annuus]|nr:hypothetical protein HanRHA438_Chr10g0434651 [Helianthus annuus]